jgi:hypothetical protein
LEGTYTKVLIDGTPIVNGLSTAHGLIGILDSLIETVEALKCCGLCLYGYEAASRQLT